MPDDSLSTKHPPGQPVLAIDGDDLLHMISAGFAWLKQHSHIVNALNVFPVPDGDTGTNMVLTMQSAWKMATEAAADGAIDGVALALANGAVRGARGNSGVILSQILRGFAENVRGAGRIDAQHFAAAMRHGKETAYKGVLKPVEGTILTVIREAADATGHAAAISSDLRFVLETTVVKAQQALANTPNLLPVLKQAGVVDAGGQGLCYLLEGMAKYLWGDRVLSPDQIHADASRATEAEMKPGMASPVEATMALPQPDLSAFAQEEWGYDIQYLVYGENLDENAIRQRLVEMGGESVVVGRAGPVVKVHVHSNDPGPFLSYGAALGHLDDIVLENMTLQTLRRKGEWSEEGPKLPQDTSPAETPAPAISAGCPGVVAVVAGDGLRKVFESLGVCALVSGGQTMNPSTEELLRAAEQLPHEDVIILPNNKNVILAARQAATIASKRLHVVETRSAPQGIAAMLGYNPAADVEQNLRSMADSAQSVHTAEITTAVREAHIDDVHVQEGDVIGLIDGRLACKGESPDAVVRQVLALIDPDGKTELFTLYYGEPVTTAEAHALCEQLQYLYPNHVVELLPGGQPHYHYLISIE